jgi:hypothetical protein
MNSPINRTTMAINKIICAIEYTRRVHIRAFLYASSGHLQSKAGKNTVINQPAWFAFNDASHCQLNINTRSSDLVQTGAWTTSSYYARNIPFHQSAPVGMLGVIEEGFVSVGRKFHTAEISPGFGN